MAGNEGQFAGQQAAGGSINDSQMMMGQANMSTPGNMVPTANMLGLVNLMNQGLLPGQANLAGNATNPMVGSLLETANAMGLANLANPAGMMGLVSMLGAGNLVAPGNVLLNNPLLAAQGGPLMTHDKAALEGGVMMTPGGSRLGPGAFIAPGGGLGAGFGPMMNNNDGAAGGHFLGGHMGPDNQLPGPPMMNQPPPALGDFGQLERSGVVPGTGGHEERPTRFNRGPPEPDFGGSIGARAGNRGWEPAARRGGLEEKGLSFSSQPSDSSHAIERNWQSQAPPGSSRQEAGYGQYGGAGRELRKDDQLDRSSRDERSRRDTRRDERGGRPEDRDRSRHLRGEERERKDYGQPSSSESFGGVPK